MDKQIPEEAVRQYVATVASLAPLYQIGFTIAKDFGEELSEIAAAMESGNRPSEAFSRLEKGLPFVLQEGKDSAKKFKEEVQKLKGYLLK
jgi:hypothetical protein